MSRRYILKDYASVQGNEEPRIYLFKNKDEVIQQLLSWCNAEARIEYEVKE